MLKYVIPLCPVSKKNHQRILVNKATGRPFVMPSEQYKRYEQEAAWYLKPRPPKPIDVPCNVKCVFYMQTKRRCDLVNLLEAADDLLVTAGILADDNYGIVAGHDGSRVRLDRENPRTEITITEAGAEV